MGEMTGRVRAEEGPSGWSPDARGRTMGARSAGDTRRHDVTSRVRQRQGGLGLHRLLPIHHSSSSNSFYFDSRFIWTGLPSWRPGMCCSDGKKTNILHRPGIATKELSTGMQRQAASRCHEVPCLHQPLPGTSSVVISPKATSKATLRPGWLTS